jgi:hypothetical protein
MIIVWKKIISSFIIICFLVQLVGCSGGNPTIPPEDEESSEYILFIKNRNPEDNVLALAGNDKGEVVAILGGKDSFGNPIEITGAVYASEQGDAFIIDAGDDGLPTYILDSTGNKVVFTNYTDSTVEISIYNSDNALIEGPTTITVNPDDLITLKQLYSSVNSKNKDAVDVIAFALKWGGFALNLTACIVSFYSSLIPLIIKYCGSTILSIIVMFTPNDIDNLLLSYFGVLNCATIILPQDLLSCYGSIMSFFSQVNNGGCTLP